MKNSNFLSIFNFAGGGVVQIILALLLGYSNLLGQANTCGTPTNQTDVTPTANNAPAGPFFVKTYLHVIRKSDKSGGLTVEDVNSVIPFLNSDYNLHNIYFSLACVNYIDNTSLYFNDGNLLLQEITPNSQSFRADGLNIYLIPFGVPLAAEFSGKAHDIRSQSLYIYYRQNDRNITHEVGHCLGLYHTFRGTCFESAPLAAAFAQPNCPTCDVTGDLVADTPGDDGGYLPQCAQGTPYTSCNQGCCDPNNNLFVLSDPKNIMSYGGMNCWQYFTPGQGERMRTLIKPEMLLSAPTVILQNTTLTGTMEMTTDLVVKAPFTLTIDGGTVKMAPGRKIIVEGGNGAKGKATLNVINGGKLTRLVSPNLGPCNNSLVSEVLWEGVELGQGINAQGGRFTSLSDAIVEYARKAIRLAPTKTLLNRGSVTCASTTFRNNNLSLAIEEELVPFSLGSSFTFNLCTFIRDANYEESDFDNMHHPTFNGHVVARLAPGLVRFNKCKFLDDNSRKAAQLNSISSFSSSFSILNLSEIRYTKRGVRLSGSNYFGLSVIENNDFYNQGDYGIDATGVEPVISKNRFILDDLCSGIVNLKTVTTTIKGNIFSGGSNGVVLTDASKTPTTIFKNIYNYSGSSGSLLYNNNVGVAFRCNTFNTTADNILNAGDINPLQGSKARPAGNVFLNTSVSDFKNFGSNVSYFYDLNVANENPRNSIGLTEISTSSPSQCNEVGIDMTPQEAATDYQIHKIAHEQLKQNLAAALDGGNTTFWVTSVQNATAQNAASIKGQLLAMSPYLSNQLIKVFFIRTDLYSTAERINLIAANSHLLLDKSMVDFLQSGTAALTPAEINSIPISDTQRLADESEINYRLFGWNNAIGEALRNLNLEDTLDFGAIRMWLARRNNFEGYMQLADSYLFSGSFPEWHTSIDNVPNMIPLSAAESTEWAAYKSMYQILEQVANAGRTFKQLTASELASMNAIAVANSTRSNDYAKSFLTEFYGYSFGSGNGQKASLNLPAAEATQSPKSISEFTVYPNPASNELNIVLGESYNDQEIEVNFYDLLGVAAHKSKLLASTINPIRVSTLPKGYYLLQVVTSNGNFNTRILINK